MDCGAAFGGGGRTIDSPLAVAVAAAAFILDRPTFFDLSPRVKLRLTGADVDRYLNSHPTTSGRRTPSAIRGVV